MNVIYLLHPTLFPTSLRKQLQLLMYKANNLQIQYHNTTKALAIFVLEIQLSNAAT